MARLPEYFRDRYLSAEREDVRRSGLPVDLAHHVDAAAPAGEPLELGGTVLHYMTPRALAANVGPVSASIIPAALDALLPSEVRSSYFLDMFALFARDVAPAAFGELGAPLRRSLIDALLDHFEEIGRQAGRHDTAGLPDEVAALVDECSPELGLFEVRFRFAPGPEPRGARLLGYLFDARPKSLAPAPWPARVQL